MIRHLYKYGAFYLSNILVIFAGLTMRDDFYNWFKQGDRPLYGLLGAVIFFFIVIVIIVKGEKLQKR